MASKSLMWGGSALILTIAPVAAQAGQLAVELTIPQQKVAEYHKPYIAGWLEDANGKAVKTLFVWYDVKKRENAGQKWLPDVRTWWRKAGREMTLPVDGVTGATRAPGRQTLTLDSAALKGLSAGQYNFVVEAAREAGGRDLVRVPVAYNPTKAVGAQGKGEGELGAVSFTYKP
jgi:hypothetical protein